jgi:hypothetical protein
MAEISAILLTIPNSASPDPGRRAVNHCAIEGTPTGGLSATREWFGPSPRISDQTDGTRANDAGP